MPLFKHGNIFGLIFSPDRDMETKTDRFEAEMKPAKKQNDSLTNTVKQQERKIKQIEGDPNDLQQYSRRWHLRVYTVPEAEAATADDCISTVSGGILSEKVGI